MTKEELIAQMANSAGITKVAATVALEAFEHQQVPFEKLVEELKPERSLSHTPLFQAMFTLQNTSLDTLSIPGLNIHRVETEPGVAKYDLSLFLRGTSNGGFSGYFEYADDLFDATTIARLAGHFAHLLEAAVRTPASRVRDLPLLDASERRQLLEDCNDTRHPGPVHTVASLFEA